MAIKNKAQLKADVNNTIKANGVGLITGPKDNVLRNDLIDSIPTLKDGGLFEVEVGYVTGVTPTSDYMFATKKYVDDNGGGGGISLTDLSAVNGLTYNNTTGEFKLGGTLTENTAINGAFDFQVSSSQLLLNAINYAELVATAGDALVQGQGLILNADSLNIDYSVINTKSHLFYVGASPKVTINSTGLISHNLSGAGDRYVGVDLSGTLKTMPSPDYSYGVPFGDLDITINADPSKIDITEGDAYFLDDYTTPGEIKTIKVSYAGATAVPVTNIATNTFTIVCIKKDGTITQRTTFPDQDERKDEMPLAHLGHSNFTSVQSVVRKSPFFVGSKNLLDDYLFFVGIHKVGFIPTNGSPATLQVSLSSGNMFGVGLGYSAQSTYEKHFAAETPSSFRIRTQTGGASGPVNLLTPLVYDNAGTITAIPGSSNQATNMRWFKLPNGNNVIQLGQQIYSNLTAAKNGAFNESFVIFPNLGDGAVLVAVISITKGCTDTSNANTCFFHSTGVHGDFGLSAGQVATFFDATTDIVGTIAPTNNAIATDDTVNVAFNKTQGQINAVGLNYVDYTINKASISTAATTNNITLFTLQNKFRIEAIDIIDIVQADGTGGLTYMWGNIGTDTLERVITPQFQLSSPPSTAIIANYSFCPKYLATANNAIKLFVKSVGCNLDAISNSFSIKIRIYFTK